MKNLPLPYLSTFLLLTACVSLLGNAKVLLLQNNTYENQMFIASENRITPQANKSTTQLVVENKSIASHQPLDDKFSSNPRKSLTQQTLSTDRKPSATEKLFKNKEIPKPPEPKPASEVALHEAKNPSIDTRMGFLSEALINDSIASTIKSLENIINEASKKPQIQQRNNASNDVKVTNFKSNYAFQNELAVQAERRLHSKVTYDGRYLKIGYPMGDVPANMGVCTDVVIRAYRGLGIDLQQRVHEDMRRNFRSYPNNWQLSRPDSNIDHRRVPNLMTYFKRAGASLPISNNPLDYHAGDIVAWDMGNGLTHIGIVSRYVSDKTQNPLIVHNIGVGPEMTDILFNFRIIGHYKYGGNSHKKALEQKMSKL